MVFLLEVIAELIASAAPAAGAPPNRAAAPASTPPASNNRRRSVHDASGNGWSSRMRIAVSLLRRWKTTRCCRWPRAYAASGRPTSERCLSFRLGGTQIRTRLSQVGRLAPPWSASRDVTLHGAVCFRRVTDRSPSWRALAPRSAPSRGRPGRAPAPVRMSSPSSRPRISTPHEHRTTFHGGLLSGSSRADPRRCEDPYHHPNGRSCVDLALTLQHGNLRGSLRIQLCGRLALERGRAVVGEDAFPARQGRRLWAFLVLHRRQPQGAATWRPRSGARPCPTPGMTP